MKLLEVDCESFPNVGLTWGTWDQKVIEVLRRRMVCSISWKWLGDQKVEHMALPDFYGYPNWIDNPDPGGNTKMVRAFRREVLAKADVVIGHNLVEFDDKMIATDMFLNHIAPAAPHRVIDTLKECRMRFRLNSNRLDDVCEELGIGKKLKHPGIKMWKGCMRGDERMWSWMRRYNNHDVFPLLDGLYGHLRPWIRRHPNVSIDKPVAGCPSCGAAPAHIKHDGVRHTQAMSYKKAFCTKCRSWCMGVTVRGKLMYRSY